MKAVLLTRVGLSKNLIYQSVATPRPANDEALVKIKYCGLNHLDLLIAQGKRPGPKNFPHVLGSEIVGTIEKIKSRTGAFHAGDTVSVYPWTFCGKCPQCRGGNEQICDIGGTIGRTSWGGYAQYAVVPVRNLMKVPRSLALDTVCSVTLAGTTAVHLVERVGVRQGATVLVTGGTGGVGTLVIQLLKHKQCTVVCTTSHEKKATLLTTLGADVVLSTKNLVGEVRHRYPGGMPHTIDIMGGDVWSNVVETLAKNGTVAFCATTREEVGQVNIGMAFSRQVNILGSYGGTREHLKQALVFLKKKVFKPNIAAVYPLARASEAMRAMETQKLFGKILFKP